ncbi:MAG: hypothetical protein ACYCQK_02730 [Acidiferrobacteraceae bacterium]
MKTRAEIALAWWVVLTLLLIAADLALHPTQVALWIHHAAGMIGAYRAAGEPPGATLIAVAKTLPLTVYLIPAAAAVAVGSAWWAVARRGDNGSIQRGSHVVDAGQGARIVKQRRSK